MVTGQKQAEGIQANRIATGKTGVAKAVRRFASAKVSAALEPPNHPLRGDHIEAGDFFTDPAL